MYAENNTLSINEPVINNSDKLDTYYRQDKWRINFGFIHSLHILEQSAEAFVSCFGWKRSPCAFIDFPILWQRQRLQGDKRTYFGDPVGDLPSDHQPLDEGPRGDEGPVDLEVQNPGNVSEGFQLLHVLADALQVVVVEVVLRVEQLEQVLQQARPEVVQHLLQVDIAAGVVALQLGEQVLEQARVLRVELPVRALEHASQWLLRVLQQLQEKLWGGKGSKGNSSISTQSFTEPNRPFYDSIAQIYDYVKERRPWAFIIQQRGKKNGAQWLWMINVKVLIASCNKIFISSFTDAGAAAVTPSVDPLFCHQILKYWCTVKRQKKKSHLRKKRKHAFSQNLIWHWSRRGRLLCFSSETSFLGLRWREGSACPCLTDSSHQQGWYQFYSMLQFLVLFYILLHSE